MTIFIIVLISCAIVGAVIGLPMYLINKEDKKYEMEQENKKKLQAQNDFIKEYNLHKKSIQPTVYKSSNKSKSTQVSPVHSSNSFDPNLDLLTTVVMIDDISSPFHHETSHHDYSHSDCSSTSYDSSYDSSSSDCGGGSFD